MKMQNAILLDLTRLVMFSVAVASLFAGESLSVPGYGNHLDYSFAGDGIVESLAGTSAPDIAIQSNEKIVIASSSQGNFLLTRLNTDGTLDTSFAGDGTLSIDFDGNGSDLATALLIQPDGKIVVVGSGTNDYAIARVNPSGVLDLGFSGDGRARFDFQGGADYAQAVALGPNGKIVVAGTVDNGLGWGVLQLNPNGSLDSTFSSDGKVVTDIGGTDRAIGVAIRIDGKIVVAGTTRLFGSDDNDFALVRYNTNGTLDTTFGGDGRITSDIQGLNNDAFAMKQTLSGMIVIVGNSGSGAFSAITVARYSASGQFDTSFNGTGWANFDVHPGSYEFAFDLILGSAGDITLTGYVPNKTANRDLLLMRIRNNGSLDPTFGTNGRVITVFGNEFSLGGYGIARQQSGRIVVAGAATHVPTYISSTFASRYTLEGAAVPGDMTGDAQAEYALFRPDTGMHWIMDSSSGDDSSYQFGVSGDVPVPGDYDRDGKTDVAVFREGTWYVLRSSDLSFFSVAFGLGGDKAAQGDYDGDGYCDTAVFRPSEGTWYIQYTGNGTTISTQFGTAEDKPAQADYDGDGLTDLALFRPSDRVWYLQQSKSGFYSKQFGSSQDRPLPADYDGDGRADLAFYRPVTAEWWFIKSQSNNQSYGQFGLAGDIPAPADFDRDGKADLTVFRPSNGTWYVQKSSGGSNTVQFGMAGDIPLSPNYSAQ